MIIALVIILDQAVKYWVLHNLAEHNGFVFIPDFISILHQHNTGMAFSIFADNPVFMRILTTGLVAFLTFLAYRLRGSRPLISTAFAFILGGAYSNLIDRYIHGFVVDYINFLFVDFAVFNIADVALNIGGFLLLLDLILKKEPNAN